MQSNWLPVTGTGYLELNSSGVHRITHLSSHGMKRTLRPNEPAKDQLVLARRLGQELAGFSKDEQTEAERMVHRILKELSTKEAEIFWTLLANPFQNTEEIGKSVWSQDWNKKRVHKFLFSLRSRLDEYFASPAGFAERFRVSVPISTKTRKYRVSFDVNSLPQNATSLWEPALNNGKPTVVAITEPPFAREARAHRFYIRDFRVNREGPEACEQIRRNLGGLGDASLETAFHYVSIAEVRGMIACIRYLQSWAEQAGRIQPEFRSCRQCLETEDVNFVLMGTTRANLLLKALQAKHHLGIILLADKVKVINATEIERSALPAKSLKTGDISLEDWSANNEVYVIVTRAITDKVITLVASNHGLATQAACEYLCNDSRVTEFIRWAQLDRAWKGFPQRFQILFSVILNLAETKAEDINPLVFRTG